MTRRKIAFVIICVLLWPVAIFVGNRLVGLFGPIVWWCATQSGATRASRPIFITDNYLLLLPAIGATLGLIPIRRLSELAASTFAVFRRKGPKTESSELGWTRPILWGWVLPTLAFLIRFTLWKMNRDQSVLGPLQHSGAGGLEHFFGASAFAMGANPLLWFYDRLFFTGPMLFLVAYTVAVWLRRHLPQHAPPDTEALDPVLTDTLGS